VPAVPEVGLAAIHGVVGGTAMLHGSVDVIITESIPAAAGSFKLVLSTTNDEGGGFGGLFVSGDLPQLAKQIMQVRMMEKRPGLIFISGGVMINKNMKLLFNKNLY